MAGTHSSQSSQQSPLPPFFEIPDHIDIETFLEETEPSNTESNTTQTKKNDFNIWTFFERKNDEQKAICKICHQKYKFLKGWGVGTLKRHLINNHPDKLPQTKQTQISIGGNITGTFKYNSDKEKIGQIEWLARKELPLSIVACPVFEEYVQKYLQPDYKKSSKKSGRRRSLDRYQELKNGILTEFMTSQCKFSLISDSWKSEHKKEYYIVVTCHWINNSWSLQKRILAFQRWEFPHSGAHIARIISNVVYDYGISDRIFSIFFDNTSANTTAVNSLKNSLKTILNGAFFHVRCACHIINLCVKDGLAMGELFLQPIRDLIHQIRNSAVKTQEMRQLCILHNKKYKKFKMECDTRWNSTYDMLQGVLPFQNILIEFANSNYEYGFIDNTAFEFASTLTKLLEIFYLCTKLFSGYYYLTNHLMLPNLCKIIYVFNQFENEERFGEIVLSMKTKFLKYYEKILILYLVASVLDPRVKVEGAEMLIDCFAQTFLSEMSINPHFLK